MSILVSGVLSTKMCFNQNYEMEFPMIKLIIFVSWLQVGCVYTHTRTNACRYSLKSMHFILSLCGQKY